MLAPSQSQIEAECSRFGKPFGIAAACVYGGAPREKQLTEIDAGVHVLVATPGRLIDFLNTGEVRLDEVNYVVLDEADRMLDLGFEPQIREILKIVPSGRQALFFSATWPPEVNALALSFLKPSACRVAIGQSEAKLTANADVVQRILFLSSEAQRDTAVGQQLRMMPPDSRVLIFCSTKRSCDALLRLMRKERKDLMCGAIHGDKDQFERERALAEFRTGAVPILIATDVAARGLDVKDVSLVLNYEFPSKTEDYIHRIGRTGRAGASLVRVARRQGRECKLLSTLCPHSTMFSSPNLGRRCKGYGNNVHDRSGRQARARACQDFERVWNEKGRHSQGEAWLRCVGRAHTPARVHLR